MECSKSEGHSDETVTKDQSKIHETDKRYTCSDVVFVIAIITIGQGTCFLGVSMLLDDVTVLPHDPLTLIGSMYLATGIAFILISKIIRRTGVPSENTTTEDRNQTSGSLPLPVNDYEDNYTYDSNADIGYHYDHEGTNNCQADEKDCSDVSSGYQWDIVGTSGDFNTTDSAISNNTTISSL